MSPSRQSSSSNSALHIPVRLTSGAGSFHNPVHADLTTEPFHNQVPEDPADPHQELGFIDPAEEEAAMWLHGSL